MNISFGKCHCANGLASWEIFACFAEVAAPIIKLCGLKLWGDKPMLTRIAVKAEQKCCRVRVLLCSVKNRAPGCDPLRKGVKLSLWRTDNAVCPVGAVLAYLAVRSVLTIWYEFVWSLGLFCSQLPHPYKINEQWGHTHVLVGLWTRCTLRSWKMQCSIPPKLECYCNHEDVSVVVV